MRVPVSTIGATIRFGYGWKFGVRKRFGQPRQIIFKPEQERRPLIALSLSISRIDTFSPELLTYA